MSQLLRLLFQLSWVLGLLCILAGAIVKLLHWEAKLTIAGRTLFLLACALFLCALATREMQRSP